MGLEDFIKKSKEILNDFVTNAFVIKDNAVVNLRNKAFYELRYRVAIEEGREKFATNLAIEESTGAIAFDGKELRGALPISFEKPHSYLQRTLKLFHNGS